MVPLDQYRSPIGFCRRPPYRRGKRLAMNDQGKVAWVPGAPGLTRALFAGRTGQLR